MESAMQLQTGLAVAALTILILGIPVHGESAHEVAEGTRLLVDGSYSQAIEVFDQAVRLHVQLPQIYSGRAFAEFALGRYPEALRDYNKAVKLAPSVAEYYVGRAITLGKLSRFDSARADFNQALRLNPQIAVHRTQGFELAATPKFTAANDAHQLEALLAVANKPK